MRGLITSIAEIDTAVAITAPRKRTIAAGYDQGANFPTARFIESSGSVSTPCGFSARSGVAQRIGYHFGATRRSSLRRNKITGGGTHA